VSSTTACTNTSGMNQYLVIEGTNLGFRASDLNYLVIGSPAVIYTDAWTSIAQTKIVGRVPRLATDKLTIWQPQTIYFGWGGQGSPAYSADTVHPIYSRTCPFIATSFSPSVIGGNGDMITIMGRGFSSVVPAPIMCTANDNTNNWPGQVVSDTMVLCPLGKKSVGNGTDTVRKHELVVWQDGYLLSTKVSPGIITQNDAQ
jgi:hypothetical protein